MATYRNRTSHELRFELRGKQQRIAPHATFTVPDHLAYAVDGLRAGVTPLPVEPVAEVLEVPADGVEKVGVEMTVGDDGVARGELEVPATEGGIVPSPAPPKTKKPKGG